MSAPLTSDLPGYRGQWWGKRREKIINMRRNSEGVYENVVNRGKLRKRAWRGGEQGTAHLRVTRLESSLV